MSTSAMLRKITRAFGQRSSAAAEKLPSPVDVDVEHELYNRLNEVQLLVGHRDIVRMLVRIDEHRLASASDDHKIIIWDTQQGAILHELHGHTLNVACLLLVPLPASMGGPVLVSGSKDKTIRIWNITDGSEIQTLVQHTSAVRSLVLLDPTSGQFCSGASDNQLIVWDARTGEQVGSMQRPESDYLQTILYIREGRLVVASENYLSVYDTKTMTCKQHLSSPSEKAHREALSCLALAPYGGLFASASLDGEIKVWSTKTLRCAKSLNYQNEYRDEDHKFTLAVQCLLPIDDRHLLAGVGTGFSLWNVLTGECLLLCQRAHRASVEHIATLYNNERIITCSADSSIRIWGPENLLAPVPSLAAAAAATGLGRRQSVTGPQINNQLPPPPATATVAKAQGIETFFAPTRRTLGGLDKTGAIGAGVPPPASPSGHGQTISAPQVDKTPPSPSKDAGAASPAAPVCIAELLAHNGDVKVAVAMSGCSFAAAGSDGLITLWKDGMAEMQRRNEQVQALVAKSLSVEEELL